MKSGWMLVLVGLFACFLVGAGCGRGDGAEGKRLRVVTTTTMIGDLVKQVAGERVELSVIMGAGVDPHTFKPSTADLGRIARADLVLYNGLHLEGKMVELFERELKQKAVAVTRNIPHDRLLAWAEGETGAHDPHVWFDVSLWALAAEEVGRVLAERDPANAEAYSAGAKAAAERMAALDSYARQQLASVPAEKRVLITSHDAYNYFGRAYGIEVRGLQGISTESEAGLASIASAVDFILARKIPAIFVESSVSPKTIERVRDDCRARGVEVKIGGELYSDAMGSPGEHEGYAVETYEGMVRYNVDTIVRALREEAE